MTAHAYKFGGKWFPPILTNAQFLVKRFNHHPQTWKDRFEVPSWLGMSLAATQTGWLNKLRFYLRFSRLQICPLHGLGNKATYIVPRIKNIGETRGFGGLIQGQAECHCHDNIQWLPSWGLGTKPGPGSFKEWKMQLEKAHAENKQLQEQNLQLQASSWYCWRICWTRNNCRGREFLLVWVRYHRVRRQPLSVHYPPGTFAHADISVKPLLALAQPVMDGHFPPPHIIWGAYTWRIMPGLVSG